jgi:predicted acetyltransferase
VHLDGDGTVDGVVLYKPDGRDGDKRKLKVTEMMSLTTTAGLALWSFLGGIDLINHVTFPLGHPDDPLQWALTDINAVHYTAHEEFLWVRVLDVEVALAARPRSTDGRVVLEVEDAQGHASGRYQVETTDGRAVVKRTDDDAEVRLDTETLGSLYLGGAHVSALARAGRLQGTDETVDRFAAMADLAEPPYNLTGF